MQKVPTQGSKKGFRNATVSKVESRRLFIHIKFGKTKLGTGSNTSLIKFAKSYNWGFNSGFLKLNFPKVMFSHIIEKLCLGLEHSLPKLYFIRSSNLRQVTSYLCRLYFSRLHFFYKKSDRENIVIITNIVLLRNYSSSYSIQEKHYI